MAKVNRGKQFEEQIKFGFEKAENASVIRLIDPQNGYAGVRNICDFIVYKKPTQYFIECKSCYGNTLPFSNITDNQWQGLLRQSRIDGVIAGYIIWFIDHDVTIFVSAQDMNDLKTKFGHKSFNITKWDYNDWYHFKGKKRKILFDYYMDDFFKEIH